MKSSTMAPSATLIDGLKERVLAGGEITEAEAMQLMGLADAADLACLQDAAHEITVHFNAREPGLCSLINAKSNLCGEDCGFCSQSVRFDTRVDAYDLMPAEEVVRIAKKFEKKGTKNFCVVTSGGALNSEEFEKVIEIYRQLKKETTMNLDGSLGFLTPERIRRLKEAGVRRYNDNLQSSREFYPKIVSTHSYDTRLETLRMLQEGNMEICSGGILGMGETPADRVKLALELKPYNPHCLPMNILNPRPGTPLEGVEKPVPQEMLKTIAVFRFIHPKANIKLAGGREIHLSPEEQERALQGGANGLIIGGYLTTHANPVHQDMEMLKRAGYEPSRRSEASSTSAAS